MTKSNPEEKGVCFSSPREIKSHSGQPRRQSWEAWLQEQEAVWSHFHPYLEAEGTGSRAKLWTLKPVYEVVHSSARRPKGSTSHGTNWGPSFTYLSLWGHVSLKSQRMLQPLHISSVCLGFLGTLMTQPLSVFWFTPRKSEFRRGSAQVHLDDDPQIQFCQSGLMPPFWVPM